MAKISCKGFDWWFYRGGQGPMLVFLHGFPFDRMLFHSSCLPLTDAYSVLIPDLPGFGESSFFSEDAPTQFTIGAYADGLACLFSDLHIEKAVLCGLSMGGYIAMQFFRRYPQLLSGLIFCDTRSTPDSREAVKKRLDLADTVYQTDTAMLAESMIPKLLSTNSQRYRENEKFLFDMIARQGPSGIAAAARGMALRDDSTPYLPEISVPTLVVGGEDDQISPPEAMTELASRIPGSELVLIKNAGHLPPLENPIAFENEVRCFADRIY